MPDELSRSDLTRFFAIAESAARGVSNDDQVTRGAADRAVQQLIDYLDSVSPVPAAREAWVRTVARNDARRTGDKLHREVAFGRQGSIPPRQGDDATDDFVATLIAEMHHGAGSLGSLVATKVDFERCWNLLSDDARQLLYAKYVDGKSSKLIAAETGGTPGAVDMQLTRVKATARLLFQGFYDDFAGP